MAETSMCVASGHRAWRMLEFEGTADATGRAVRFMQRRQANKQDLCATAGVIGTTKKAEPKGHN